MKPDQDQTPEGTAVGCDVTAHALVRVPLAALPELRRQPGPPSAPCLAANLLKHSDEQSVAGLAAVYRAIHDHGLQATDFTHWGVLGAPRFPGRTLMIPTVKRFLAEGAWDVSPHTIPHRSLHSLSGTISQVLKIHGPNFGVGGGNSAAEEIVFAALALLERHSIPGVWMVVTAQEPEGLLDDSGSGPPEKCVRALALALTRSRPDWCGLRLSLEMVPAVKAARSDYFRLFTMLEHIVRERAPGRSVTQAWQHCARLTLAWAAAPVEPRPSGSAADADAPLRSRVCLALETPR